jgi:acetylornithine deacetylase
MNQTVISLTQDLVRIPSVSRDGNEAVTTFLSNWLEQHGFEVETLVYNDDNGVPKYSLVAKLGLGTGGIGFFSHSDTVPVAENEWPAFEPTIRDGKLYGRGSCDMKGPLAASMIAATLIDKHKLKKPVYIGISADEESGFGGVKQIVAESKHFKSGFPEMGIIPEPSELKPIYAHKGGYWMVITARGEAAHTSTDKGISSNFLIAPFLAEMAQLKERFMTEAEFMDHEFNPPTNGFNMTLNDDNCAGNVTAAKTTCVVNFRTMSKVDNLAIVNRVKERALHYGFEFESRGFEPFYSPKDAEVIRLSCEVTGEPHAITVPYGTEALIYQQYLPLVILGPGNIAQAHTVGEWVEVCQLERAVEIYKKMMEKVCY